jgi:hypothetical protein
MVGWGYVGRGMRMWIHEQDALRMVKQRVKEAERAAAQAREVRLARASRPGVRVRLGVVFVRLGWWIMGNDARATARPIPAGRAPS